MLNMSPTEMKNLTAVKILWFTIIFDKIYAKLKLIFTGQIDLVKFLGKKKPCFPETF